jgi:hypothetical protein
MNADRPQDPDRRSAEPARGRFVDASPVPSAGPEKTPAGPLRTTVPRQPDATSPRTAAPVAPLAPVRPGTATDAGTGTDTPKSETPDTDSPDTARRPARAGRDRDGAAQPDRPDAALGGFLEPQRVEVLSAEWSAVQAGFVDDPAGAVEQADELVARAADLVAEAVRRRREGLRAGQEPAAGHGTGTEELRLALRDYRSVLDRLLAS